MDSNLDGAQLTGIVYSINFAAIIPSAKTNSSINATKSQMDNKQLSVFGGTGFIGSRFHGLYPDCYVEPRDNNSPKYDDIVYLISTTHNYHPVQGNLFIDIETNLIKLMKVLENCKGRDIKFTFISSFFTYGLAKPKGKLTNEEDACNPAAFYSSTKLCAEQLLQSYCKTFDIPYRILRLSNTFGHGNQLFRQEEHHAIFP